MLRPWIFSSVFISLNAFCLCLYYGAATGSIDLPRSLLVAFATLAAYNFTQLAPLRYRRPLNERSRWIQLHSRGLWILTGASLAACAFLSAHLSLYDWINYAHLFVLALLYENTFGNRPARKIPYIKPFYISYIWSMASAFPQVYDTPSWENWPLVIEAFFFMLSLTILFDLRDIKEDAALGFATIANTFSEKKVKLLSLLLMAFALLLLAGLGYAHPLLAGSYLLTHLFLAWCIRQDSSEYAFLMGVDGMMFLKLILLL